MYLPAVSLRTDPAVEHAALPGGGSVTVWVGVPEDSYVGTALTTVDVQLHEGNATLASVSTGLAPHDDDEGRALARRVTAALEAGEIGLSAGDLETLI